jgi:microcystin-dependent protein
MTTRVSLIANDAVTGAGISNGTVSTEDLNKTAGEQAVTTDTIRDGAVTATKLQSSASNNTQRAVGTNHIRDGAVTSDKLSSPYALVPLGGIIMWSGTIANIPTGWALCNGANGTPNLTSKFIVGAGSDSGTGVTFNATTGATSGSYAPGNSGGQTAHQLTIAELASHNHEFGNGNYYWTGDAAVPKDFGNFSGNSYEMTTTSAVASQGGNQYHENRPPYYALAFIIRVL